MKYLNMNKKRLLIIDNYDSFTYNLYQLAGQVFKGNIDVFKNDEINLKFIREQKYLAIIISPGPKEPKDSPLSKQVISNFYQYIPILGICLGMQCINEVFGGKTIKADYPVHGKTTYIKHNREFIFKDIFSPLKVGRYHSLIIEKNSPELIITAKTNNNIVMGIKHKKYSLFGLQFHPESFLTDCGLIMMKNFIKFVG